MLQALIVVTIIEVIVLLAVLALYLLVIMRRLRTIAQLLGHITFGVRAIEKQVANIEPNALRLNQRLSNLAEALAAAREQAAAR